MHFKCLDSARPMEGPQEAAALGNVVSCCLSGEPFLLFIRKSYPEQLPSFLAQEVYRGRDLSNLHFTDGETREGTCPGSPGSLWRGINQVEPTCNLLPRRSPGASHPDSGNGPGPFICSMVGKSPRCQKAVFLLSSSAPMPGIRKWGDGKCPV